jgi:hypothetical protein
MQKWPQSACFGVFFYPTKINTMQKQALTFGSMAGAILILLFLLQQAIWFKDPEHIDFKKGEILGYISMLVSLSMIFFGIRSYRDKHLNGFITFGKAFQVGLWITLIASTIYVVGWVIYYNTSETMQKFPELYLNFMMEELKKSGVSTTEIAAKEAEFRSNMELYKNPFFMIAITFLEIFPVGLVIDLISAFLLRNNAPKPENAN